MWRAFGYILDSLHRELNDGVSVPDLRTRVSSRVEVDVRSDQNLFLFLKVIIRPNRETLDDEAFCAAKVLYEALREKVLSS